MQEMPLAELGRALKDEGYQFTTITPLSHARVLGRTSDRPATLREIFGWSRPFHQDDLPRTMLHLLEEAGCLAVDGRTLRSKVRFSSLGDQLFVHSAFPTAQADAVFFGPDTYRFAGAIDQVLLSFSPRPGARILDIGAGSGAGGLHGARALRTFEPQVMLTDINAAALRFSEVNAALNDVAHVKCVESNLYRDIAGLYDLIISNPPYLVDPEARFYRHGGGEFGWELSLRIVEEGLPHLADGGRLLLYTGAAIVDGVDLFEQALREAIKKHSVAMEYREIDPDVFGEELEAAPYDRADRIAVVAAVLQHA